MVLIWEKEIEKDSNWKKLPVVIPLVFYHGKDKWNIDTKFSNILNVSNDTLKKYAFDFEYVFCDISKYSDGNLLGDALTKLAMLTFKHIFDSKADWVEIIQKVSAVFDELVNNPSALDDLKTFLTYLLETADVDREAVHKVVKEKFQDSGGGVFMSVAEELRLEGKLEEKKEVARKMLNKGFDKKTIIELTELPAEEIEKLIEETRGKNHSRK